MPRRPGPQGAAAGGGERSGETIAPGSRQELAIVFADGR